MVDDKQIYETEESIDILGLWQKLKRRRKVFLLTLLVVFSICSVILFSLFTKQRKFIPVYEVKAQIMIAPETFEVTTPEGQTIKKKKTYSSEVPFLESDAVKKEIARALKDENGYRESEEELLGEIDKSLKFKAAKTKGTTEGEVIEIIVTSDDPKKAFDIADSVVEAYNVEKQKVAEDFFEKVYKTYTEQLTRAKENLSDAENRLATFIMENKELMRIREIHSLFEENKEAITYENLTGRYTKNKSDIAKEEKFIKGMKELAKEDRLLVITNIDAKYKGLVDLGLKRTLIEKKENLNRLLLEKQELHPEVIYAKRDLQSIYNKIDAVVNQALRQIELSAEDLKDQNRQLGDLLQNSGIYNTLAENIVLKKDVESKQKIYDRLLKDMQNIDIGEKLQYRYEVKILEGVSFPEGTSNKHLMAMLQVVLFSFFAGFMASFTVVNIIEIIDKSIKSVEEIEEIVKAPFLAAVPEYRSDTKAASVKDQQNLIAYTDSQSPLAEAIRGLRTNLRFLNIEKKYQVIEVTSSIPTEGKSFICSNLAIVSAQLGKKTLLIDCDMRRSVIGDRFGINEKQGLSEILINEELQPERIPFHPTKIANLSILGNRKIPPNPSELLESKNMDKILAIAKDKFDVVYLDAPPILSVTDALILAKKTDGIVLVSSINFTPRPLLVRCYKLLKNLNINILGTVSNRDNTHAAHSYSYYYKTPKKKS